MGRKDKNKKKGKGAEKTAMKTNKKLAAKQKKKLEQLGEADIVEIVAKAEAEQQRQKTTTEQLCEPPSPRSSFSLVAHPEKDELILFGGEFYNGQTIAVYNDLLFYNIAKKQWKQVRSPAGPAPRSASQMVSLPSDGGQLWLFGGEFASPSQEQFFHFKDLWCYTLKTQQWNKVEAPNGPSARSGHRMVAQKKRLFIFGGFHDNNQSYQYFNDMHVFSLESYAWLKIEVGGAMVPSPRSACCMAACPDGKVLVWSGFTKTRISKDVDHGQTHTDMFALTPDKEKPEKFKWVTVKPSGYKLKPNSGVGYTVAPNGKVYCFGGVMDVEEDEENVIGQFNNDLLCLDLNSPTWRLIELKSKANKDEPSSSVVSSKPMPRMSPGMVILKGKLYLYGGVYEDTKKQITYNDLYALDLHKLDEWDVLIPNAAQSEWIADDSDSEDSENEDESIATDDSGEAEDIDDEEEDDSDDDEMDTD